MTTRPVYIPKLTKPFYQAVPVDFDWIPGVAPVQRKKNSKALHSAFLEKHPERHILEVSTKSDDPAGLGLSPFNLKKTIPTLKKSFPVENIYHASKVFSHGGPYYDLLGATPLESKRDPRLKNSGEVVHFQMDGKEYPASPDILFYNWLYIKALKENKALADALRMHDAFTDIEFNPKTPGTNNQAKACAIYSSLAQLGLLDKTNDFEDFKKLFLENDITEIKEQTSAAKEELDLNALRKTPLKRRSFPVGSWLEHPGIGKGEVIRRTKDGYLINFRVAGPRTISKEFVETRCKPLQSGI